MKKILQTIAFLFLINLSHTHAQRYLMPVFDSVVMTDSIPYGVANDYAGNSVPLAMDIYMPYGDTASNRPLLILAHGGSFIFGDRKSADIVTICKEFAKRGYVCASIKYRLGINSANIANLSNEFANAVWRGTLDGRGAIRYFSKNVATNNNSYKIDPTNIYIGGVSAGGVLGLHVAFLDKASEAGSAFPAIDTATIGGVEGSSGSAGYSWKIKGVISLCGAIGTSVWMNDDRNVSIVSVHGTNDNTVPFKTDYFKVNNIIPIALLSGSYIVDSVARANGNVSALKVFYGQDHVPFANATPAGYAYMDTTVRFVADFLYSDIKRVQTNTSINAKDLAENMGLKIYPVPTKDKLFVQFENNNHLKYEVELFDINGRIISTQTTSSNQVIFERNNVLNGMYFIRTKSELGESFKRVIFE